MLPVKHPYQPYTFTFMQLVALSTSPKAPEHHLVFDVDHTSGKAKSKPKEDTQLHSQTRFAFNDLLPNAPKLTQFTLHLEFLHFYRQLL